MKSAFLFSLLMLYGGYCMAQNAALDDVRRTARFIPVVEYTPIDFEQVVSKAFVFDSTNSSYFVRKSGESNNIYWYNDFQHKGQFQLARIATELPLSSKQMETLLTADSAFIFEPLVYRTAYKATPQQLRYVGYRTGGVTSYLTPRKSYASLPELIDGEFGSVQNFMQTYLANLSDIFYSPGSGLFDFSTETDALRFLKDNYKFRAICGGSPEEVLPLYLELIKNRIILTQEQESRLTEQLRSSMIAHESMKHDFLAGRSFHVFNPEILRSVLSQAECKVVNGLIEADNARLAIAYGMLRLNQPNINDKGQYNTDSDILKLISDRTFGE